MNRTLIASAVALAHTLAEENDALRRLDIACAVALLPRKQAETRHFVAAQPELHVLDPGECALAHEIAARLTAAADENRRLLERAIAVQRQVIATVLRAVPAAQPALRYGATGARRDNTAPISLSSRA